MDVTSILKSGMSASLHLNEVDEVKAGTVYDSQSVWFQIDSGLQSLSIFTSAKTDSDENIKDAFKKMYGLIASMKNAVETAEQEYYK